MNRGTPMAMETPICLELPWASFSPFYIRLLQTVWHLRNHLISAGNLRTHSWGLRSYLWIMFLDQCKCLLVTNENHVQFFWTFVQTFVNNELFVHGCWHPKVFQAILHRLLMDEPWCNKRPNQFTNWLDLFQTQTALKVLREKRHISGMASKWISEYMCLSFPWCPKLCGVSFCQIPVRNESEIACDVSLRGIW